MLLYIVQIKNKNKNTLMRSRMCNINVTKCSLIFYVWLIPKMRSANNSNIKQTYWLTTIYIHNMFYEIGVSIRSVKIIGYYVDFGLIFLKRFTCK